MAKIGSFSSLGSFSLTGMVVGNSGFDWSASALAIGPASATATTRSQIGTICLPLLTAMALMMLKGSFSRLMPMSWAISPSWMTMRQAVPQAGMLWLARTPMNTTLSIRHQVSQGTPAISGASATSSRRSTLMMACER